MSPFAVLAAAGVASWALRVLFITVVPASRLPAGIRRALEFSGVAVPAALVGAALAQHGGPAALVVPSPELLALLASGAVAWRTENLMATMAGGISVYWLLGVLWQS